MALSTELSSCTKYRRFPCHWSRAAKAVKAVKEAVKAVKAVNVPGPLKRAGSSNYSPTCARPHEIFLESCLVKVEHKLDTTHVLGWSEGNFSRTTQACAQKPTNMDKRDILPMLGFQTRYLVNQKP